MKIFLVLIVLAVVLLIVMCLLMGHARKEGYLKSVMRDPAIPDHVPTAPSSDSSYTSSSDDSSSSSSSSDEGEPNNGGGPDEYGPSPGYGGGL